MTHDGEEDNKMLSNERNIPCPEEVAKNLMQTLAPEQAAAIVEHVFLPLSKLIETETIEPIDEWFPIQVRSIS